MDFVDVFADLNFAFRHCPSGSVIKNPPANAEGTGSTPGLGTKIPHATQPINKRTNKL